MDTEILLSISLLFLYATAPIGAVYVGKRRNGLRWWWPLIPLISYVITPIWLAIWGLFLIDVGYSTADRAIGDRVIAGSYGVYLQVAIFILVTPALLTLASLDWEKTKH
ncbi:hypothetical protein [Aureimonas jatrophae]|uniref:hypothetical protein n=1 Tax=Aureimonas jatrophae TaxID=1166073 RepID=UPI00111352F3|nr:hypothetical protein [Aureimonas jatrophae]MBB3952601.1 hypothetical protein [Aureimonas jatrophae]